MITAQQAKTPAQALLAERCPRCSTLCLLPPSRGSDGQRAGGRCPACGQPLGGTPRTCPPPLPGRAPALATPAPPPPAPPAGRPVAAMEIVPLSDWWPATPPRPAVAAPDVDPFVVTAPPLDEHLTLDRPLPTPPPARPEPLAHPPRLQRREPAPLGLAVAAWARGASGPARWAVVALIVALLAAVPILRGLRGGEAEAAPGRGQAVAAAGDAPKPVPGRPPGRPEERPPGVARGAPTGQAGPRAGAAASKAHPRSGASAGPGAGPAAAAPRPEELVATAAGVEAVLREHRAELRDCQVPTAEAEAGGPTLLAFTLQPGGSATEVRLVDTAADQSRVGRCLRDAVARLRFPPRAGPLLRLVVPILVETR